MVSNPVTILFVFGSVYLIICLSLLEAKVFQISLPLLIKDLPPQYNSLCRPVVIVAIAGRSNGLGPVLAGNTALPVINCPPYSKSDQTHDIWSSLSVPSGGSAFFFLELNFRILFCRGRERIQ